MQASNVLPGYVRCPQRHPNGQGQYHVSHGQTKRVAHFGDMEKPICCALRLTEWKEEALSISSGTVPRYGILTGYDLEAKGYRNKHLKYDIWFDDQPDDNRYIYLWPNSSVLIKTGVWIQFPKPIVKEGYKIMWDAEVRPRSGLALKHGITVLNTPGTIDNAYIGDIGVILINNGVNKFMIENNDRIGQLIFMKRQKPLNELFEIVDSFEETSRGDKGFGSSGR